jgi:gamma-glutamylcyclotransferase (GGCT)/AIG2-like uncharacterized protein YtfP
MALVFQYGSNMSTARLNAPNRLAGNASVRGIALTDASFELLFDIWSKGGNCAAADIIEGDRRIWGVVYEVPDHLIQRRTADQQKSLDEIEGEGGNYGRAEIQLSWRNGRPVCEPVITYVGRDRRAGIQTSNDYVAHILSGLAEHHMPASYISYVRGRIAANNPELEADR